jgi:ribosomal protein S18 acetylase RimI-like enzyme
MRDRFANAYLIGKLDDLYHPFNRWWGVRDDSGQLRHVLLVYQGLSLPVVFVAGEDNELPVLLQQSQQVIPKRFHFHVLESQLSTLRQHFQVLHYQRMHRMGLERSAWRRGPRDPRVTRLGHRDTAAIMELYHHYPDHFFEPYQLETGLYFGVREPNVGLVAIAGVHVISEEHNVAVIGNLVTHPDYRGQRLATACTSHLLDALFERVSFIALNVQSNNQPAIRLYTSFGFEPNNIYYEGRCGH